MIYINDWCLNDYVDTVDEKLFFHGESPEIMYEDVTIPGRSGKLHLDLHRFEERTIEISCWMRSDFRNRYRVLLNKLNALKGVVTLRCTPAPEMWGEGYYNTVFKGKISAPTMGSYLKNGSFVLKFNADPRYWLDTGNIPSRTLLYLNPDSVGMHRTCNFTYATGKTIKLRAKFGEGVDTGDANIMFRYPQSKSSVFLVTVQAAQTAWANGEFFDITSYLSDGDVFYIMVADECTWEIQTDLITGEMVTYTNVVETVFTNPTPFTAKPLFVVKAVDDDYSDGATYFIQFSINGIIVRVKREFVTDHSGMPLYIDCELQDCYYIDGNGVKQNANSYIQMYSQTLSTTTTDFPVLVPGDNDVSYNYGSTLYYYPSASWQMLPRWYLI